MGKQILVYIEKKLFIQVKARVQSGVNTRTPLMKRQTWNDYSTIPRAWKLYTKGCGLV